MGTFTFGAQRGAPLADPGDIAEYRLHVQEIWRIVRGAGILVGYGDYFYPPAGSPVARAAFVARDAQRTRRDELIEVWMAHGRAAHVVRSVGGTDAGDLAITFEDGCTLETFACSVSTSADGSDEFWRLVPPRAAGLEAPFVVTAHGIER
jgi:hypothetical protein